MVPLGVAASDMKLLELCLARETSPEEVAVPGASGPPGTQTTVVLLQSSQKEVADQQAGVESAVGEARARQQSP